MKFKLLVDEISYKTKPTSEETGAITNRMLKNLEEALKEYTIEEIAQVTEQGKTIVPHVLSGNKIGDEHYDRAAHFKEAQLFLIDIDNDEKRKDAKTGVYLKDDDGKTLKYALENPADINYINAVCKKYGIVPALIYESFTSRKTDPTGRAFLKYHILFASDKPITDGETVLNITKSLQYMFSGSADVNTRDIGRLLYGTVKEEPSRIIYVSEETNTAEALLSEYNRRKAAEAHEPEQQAITQRSGEFNTDIALFHISADTDRNTWLKISAAYKNTGGSFSLWEQWCRTGNYDGKEKLSKVWKSLTDEKPDEKTLKKAINEHRAERSKNLDYNNILYECYHNGESMLPKAEYMKQLSKEKYNISVGAARADQSQSSGTENTEEAQNVPPFIFYDNDKDKFKVSAPLLAEYMHNNDNYIFVKNNNPNEVSTTLYWYKNGVYSVISPEVLKGYIKKHITDFNPAILAMRHVNEVYGILTAYDEEELIEADRINADENIINFKNGLLYLDTMELKPHSPRVYSTIQIPCNWSGAAGSSPVFDKFMDEFTTGSEEHKRFLLQFMGVCLSNVRGFRMKKALFIVGAGDSGKSQLRKLTEMLIGAKYCESASMKALEDTHGGECVVNKRLVGENDMSFMSLNELKIFKLLTGGDSFQINPKNRPMFSYTYNGLLWFTANALPRFGGDRGEHVYNRMIIIKADNVIPPERRDAKLTAKMYKEREAIVYKCVLALKEVIQSGYKFDIPSTCKNELTEYKAENNPVQRFYNECCVMRTKKQKDNCTAVMMYNVFKEWCKSNNGNHIVKKQNFNKELMLIHNVEELKDIQTAYCGTRSYTFTLTQEAKEEYRRIYGVDSTTE